MKVISPKKVLKSGASGGKKEIIYSEKNDCKCKMITYKSADELECSFSLLGGVGDMNDESVTKFTEEKFKKGEESQCISPKVHNITDESGNSVICSDVGLKINNIKDVSRMRIPTNRERELIQRVLRESKYKSEQVIIDEYSDKVVRHGSRVNVMTNENVKIEGVLICVHNDCVLFRNNITVLLSDIKYIDVL